jgi:hypothetical protein
VASHSLHQRTRDHLLGSPIGRFSPFKEGVPTNQRRVTSQYRSAARLSLAAHIYSKILAVSWKMELAACIQIAHRLRKKINVSFALIPASVPRCGFLFVLCGPAAAALAGATVIAVVSRAVFALVLLLLLRFISRWVAVTWKNHAQIAARCNFSRATSPSGGSSLR